jgi:hypothetical protein
MNNRVVRAFRDCVATGVAATRLENFFHLTRGLRPGLNAKPPLRGSFLGNSLTLFHRIAEFAVATQSLQAHS